MADIFLQFFLTARALSIWPFGTSFFYFAVCADNRQMSLQTLNELHKTLLKVARDLDTWTGGM